MSIIEIKEKIAGKGASLVTLQKVQEVARSIEAVDLQAGAQDSASSTEESLGVNKVVSFPD